MAGDSTKPVDRIRATGAAAASPIDLLAIGFSRREEDANEAEEMAKGILRRFGSMHLFGQASPAEIREYTGMEGFEILRIQALIELGRRSALVAKGQVREAGSPEEVAQQLKHLRQEKKEHFCAVLLDSKNRIMKTSTIHIGTLTMSVVGVREVFREAVREGASNLIVAHNHPSGDTTPSPEDIDVTRKLAEVGRLLDIPLLDHIIIGDPDFLSFRRSGLL